MARLPAVRVLGLGVGLGVAGALLTTGAAGQAGAAGTAGTAEVAQSAPLGPVSVPDDRAADQDTDPMPRVRPRGLPPVPLPHVRRTGPGPVPIPEARAGQRDDVPPLDVLSSGRSGAAPRPGR
ncbi:hypothetical protein [Nocardioides pacificus]